MESSPLQICTYFDVNYLSRGLALYQSVRRWEPDATLWVLCLDETTFEILQALGLPSLRLVTLREVEGRYPELLSVKSERRLIEYYFTLTPHWPSFVLESYPRVDRLVYADADIRFFSSVEPVFDEMRSSSVGIVEHRFPPRHKEREVFGRFNVGTLFLRNDDNAATCMEWWRERCIEWCFDRLDGSRYADQKYLDEWPDRFKGVRVITHQGVGVAPWNWMIGEYDLATEPPLIDGQPLIAYHFHGLQLYGWSLFNPQLARYGRMPPVLFEFLYRAYASELLSLDAELRSRVADLPVARPVRQRRLARFLVGLYKRELSRARKPDTSLQSAFHEVQDR